LQPDPGVDLVNEGMFGPLFDPFESRRPLVAGLGRVLGLFLVGMAHFLRLLG
jgi:hypothetical protein